MSPSEPRPFYLDCDTGIDDALALSYLLHKGDRVRLVGIGTVSGNVSSTQAARNTLDILALANRAEIPVAEGAVQPLAGQHVPAPHVHGANGIGDIQLPRSARQAADLTAAELLLRLAHEHAGTLSIIAIGPLTNLALALQRDPTIVTKISDITIMGGAVNVPGNVSATAEANVANDPEAAARVFAANWPITLVPLDVTTQHRFDRNHQKRLRTGSDLTRNLAAMLDTYFDFYTPILGEPSIALHDPLAAAIGTGAITPTAWVTGTVQIELDDARARGTTILTPSDHPSARVRAVLSAPKNSADLLVDTILDQGVAADPVGVAVVGSINDDLTVRTAVRPAPGETVLGDALDHAPGGKGLNQALASAHGGAPTALVGAIGADQSGSRILRHAAEHHLDARAVKTVGTSTGSAIITLTPDGENSIIVISGANDELEPDDVSAALDDLQPAIVVSQMEIPLDATRAAARWAEWHSARFVLNYSPFRPDARDLLDHADPVILNRHEAALLHGSPVGSVSELAVSLSSHARSVVITDGARGSYGMSRGGVLEHTPTPPVTAVDTTGAGDTFAGALVSSLHSGATLSDAMSVGTRAAAWVIRRARADRS